MKSNRQLLRLKIKLWWGPNAAGLVALRTLALRVPLPLRMNTSIYSYVRTTHKLTYMLPTDAKQ